MGHSRFSPSATPREIECPASFLLSEMEPDNRSVDADHGTAAHFVGELCLSNNHDADRYAGCGVAVDDHGGTRFVHELAPPRPIERLFEVDDEMVYHVQRYVDWCRELPGDHFVEVRVEHTKWCPDVDEFGFPLDPQYGTSDHVACEPGTLYVTDLKYGKGVKVYAEGNTQALKYALGTYDAYDWMYNFKKIVIRIAQPRLDHFDVWELTVEELLEWGRKIKARLELVFAKDPVFGPGEKQCRFCRRAGKCRPQYDYIVHKRGLEFDAFEGKFTTSPHDLTLQELSDVWQARKMWQAQFEAIHKHLVAAMLLDREVPGLKIVKGDTHRKWRSERQTRDALLKLGLKPEQIEETSLRSPAQIELLLSQKQKKALAMMDLFYSPEGKPCIAPEKDKRPTYDRKAALAAGFDDESTDQGFHSDDGFDVVDDGFG